MRKSENSTRANALWGRGSRGEARQNALWGRGGRRAGAVVASFAFAFTGAAVAGAGSGGNGASGMKAFVQPSLLSSVQQTPDTSFDVIVEGDKNGNSNGLYKQLLGSGSGVSTAQIREQFLSLDGVHASLTGTQIAKLARLPFVSAIVANEPTVASGGVAGMNPQLWPWATKVPSNWVGHTRNLSLPTIAIVDSGIDASRVGDFSDRVLGQVNLTTSQPTATGDGYGHGTAVAGVAAGGAYGNMGVSPRANLFSVRVMNDQGAATVSDVVRAADWILRNKATYNIKVANFSLHATNRASVLFDPLDLAVEKLWLNGVVVVAAAGNYGVNGVAGGVQYAPGNDPFVITVGAADQSATLTAKDDVVAPWSAWGYTGDGFMKPEISAPGRYVDAPVSPNAAIYTLHPDKVLSPGYMELSGTSFSAPMIAGAAAELLAQNPTWTPDQVKGALMVSAEPAPAAAAGSLGGGELDMAKARTISTPPNPNAGLDQFLTTDASGYTIFNASAWQTTAQTNTAWDSAAWSSAAWSSAAWSSAAWSSAAWSDAAWASAAWGSAAWSDAAWSDAAWSDAAWADGASGEPTVDPSTTDASDTDIAASAADLGLGPSCDPTVSDCTITATTSTLLP
jgi:serine protease AprX